MELDRILQKIDGEIVELSLEDWLTHSSLQVVSNSTILSIDEDTPSGLVIDLPDGFYDPARDFLMVNQEGFVLVPGFQYVDTAKTITIGIDLPAKTSLYIVVFKFHGNHMLES